MKIKMKSIEELTEQLKQLNQIHLLKYWNELTESEREHFIEHLDRLCLNEANFLFEKTLNITNQIDENQVKPIPKSQFESVEQCDKETLQKYEKLGLEAVSRSEVGVLLMAGGQGTRLGVSYPKGMFDLGLPSGKTPFQIQAERIQRVQQLAFDATGKSGIITWYIMTSGPTSKTTDSYLKSHNFFGLNPENVVQFKQGLIPCFDFQGKIILEKKNLVAMAPDGNGGIYRALHRNGILDDMKKRGVKYIHAHSVDNILIKVADPVFIGYCIDKDSDCGAKVVSKSSPTEPVGVVCSVNGKFQVVEYSEISSEMANLRDELGNLVYSAGNICNHFFTSAFLRDIINIETELKLHVANKKIPYINEDGITVTPNEPNGIKIEKFIFDVFQFSNRFVTWEVPRLTEFSAMKNADAACKDCPKTAREDLLKLHKIYIERAGGVVDGCFVEISPLLSYAGENLAPYVEGKCFKNNTVLCGKGEISGNS